MAVDEVAGRREPRDDLTSLLDELEQAGDKPIKKTPLERCFTPERLDRSSCRGGQGNSAVIASAVIGRSVPSSA
jgi:hypothetical protein